MCHEKVHGTFIFHQGDDYVIGRAREGSAWLVEALTLKDRDVLGPDTDHEKKLT